MTPSSLKKPIYTCDNHWLNRASKFHISFVKNIKPIAQHLGITALHSLVSWCSLSFLIYVNNSNDLNRQNGIMNIWYQIHHHCGLERVLYILRCKVMFLSLSTWCYFHLLSCLWVIQVKVFLSKDIVLFFLC